MSAVYPGTGESSLDTAVRISIHNSNKTNTNAERMIGCFLFRTPGVLLWCTHHEMYTHRERSTPEPLSHLVTINPDGKSRTATGQHQATI